MSEFINCRVCLHQKGESLPSYPKNVCFQLRFIIFNILEEWEKDREMWGWGGRGKRGVHLVRTTDRHKIGAVITTAKQRATGWGGKVGAGKQGAYKGPECDFWVFCA